MKVTPEDLFARNYNILLSNNGTDDIYKAVRKSAIVRQFLIDQDALVHTINKNFKLKIFFEVDDNFIIQLSNNAYILYTSTQLGNLKLKFSARLKSLKLADFLSLKILKIDEEEFDVKEIIKFAANKQGGVHYDPKLNAEESRLSNSLDKVENVPILATAIDAIVNIVTIALRPLRDTLLTFPDYSNFFAHYDLSDQGSIRFDGKQFLETNNLNGSIIQGFGWFGEIKIVNQKGSGKKFVYQIGKLKKKSFDFSIYIDQLNNLVCSTRLNSSQILIVKLSDVYLLVNNFTSVSAILKLDSNIASLELWINRQLVDKAQVEYKFINREVERHVIGGNLKGQQNSCFYIKELMLLNKGLNDENIEAII